MPIDRLTPEFLVQSCAECGARHTLSFSRGAQKTKRGPFALKDGDTLELAADGAGPMTVTFRAFDFVRIHSATADEVARSLKAATPALDARDDFEGCLIESRTEGPASRLRVCGGSACDALGLNLTSEDDHAGRPPRLGIVLGGFQDSNTIVLRPCPCGVHEVVVRNFDQAPRHLAGSFFDQHRRLVNTLAEHLKRTGRSHPQLAGEHAAEATPPPDLAAAAVVGELVIGVASRPASVGGE